MGNKNLHSLAEPISRAERAARALVRGTGRTRRPRRAMDDALVTRLFEETTKALTEAPSVDIRELELPLARIKRIMKLEDEVQSQLDGRKNMMVSSEAPVVFAKACELFIREITTRAWTCTEVRRAPRARAAAALIPPPAPAGEQAADAPALGRGDGRGQVRHVRLPHRRRAARRR